MRRLALAVAVFAALLIGCAQARADVNANVGVYAEAGPNGSADAIDQQLNDNGSGGVASTSWGWPLAPFVDPHSVPCPGTCYDRSAGATASADEAAGVLRAGAGASVLVSLDSSSGADANVVAESSVNDTLTLSAPATVVVEGTVHGLIDSANLTRFDDDPVVRVDVHAQFCCKRSGTEVVPIGGYAESFDQYSDSPADETFSVPVDLPAGTTSFSADLRNEVDLLVHGANDFYLGANALSDFTGTVTFKVVVPDGVVASSGSGLLPIVGGAPAPPTDTTAPTSTASVAPAANAAGWENGPVAVHIGADDGAGSGVASITVATSGAQTASAVTTPGSAVDVPVSAEGVTTVTYYATDAAGNAETPKSVTVRIDESPPTVAYAGNSGSYTVDQQVAIACTATDALSGVAASTCEDIVGPAYSFALGTNTFAADATDNAGNRGVGETSFTVAVDARSVADLTLQLVTGSPAFEALPARQQVLVKRLASLAAQAVARIAPAMRPAEKKALVRGYDAFVAQLVRRGWLEQSQAATLTRLAALL
jgi:hypothetical protein